MKVPGINWRPFQAHVDIHAWVQDLMNHHAQPAAELHTPWAWGGASWNDPHVSALPAWDSKGRHSCSSLALRLA